MVVYAIVSALAREAVDLYVERAAAEADLRAVKLDDAALAHLLSIVPIELDPASPPCLN